MNANKAISKPLSVEIILANSSCFFTIFTPSAVGWDRVKIKFEELFSQNPACKPNETVKCVCTENGWSWREGIETNGPDIIIFAE